MLSRQKIHNNDDSRRRLNKIRRLNKEIGTESNNSELNKVMSKLNDDIKQIKKLADKVYIVNAGRMNHGKSSLFNSVLNESKFAVGDIRTTIERSEAQLVGPAYLVDTPGLDAVDADDEVAFNAYQKANMVVFVHTPNVGEFHKDELEKINQIIELFPSKEYFWKHFCLVFTFTEAIAEQELKSIEAKILKDIKENCGGEDFPIFYISNKRYEKGIKENKKTLVEKSGIIDFKRYLLDQVEVLVKDNEQLKNERIDNLLSIARDEITLLKNKYLTKMKKKEKVIGKETTNLVKLVNSVCDEIVVVKDRQEYMQKQIDDFKNKINNLKIRHNNELY